MNCVKVSVIVPVYNVLEYLRTCLDSLVAQTMCECEFIVVSDGASEAECSICEEYVAKDSRFKFFRRNHGGLAAVKNFGMTQAQGEYISFVDSDDWIAPDILKDAYELSRKTNSDVTFWNYSVVTPKGLISHVFSPMNSGVLSKETLVAIRENLSFLTHPKYLTLVYSWCKLYKTSIIRNMAFEEDKKIGEDWIFSLQLFLKEIRVSYLNQNSYFYRQNNNSLTKKYFPDVFKVRWNYIRRRDELSNGKYHVEICNEIFCKFLDALPQDYFHKSNPYSFRENINRLKQVFYSEDFRHVIDECSFCKLSRGRKIDYLFFKAKIFLWLYIRAFYLLLKRKMA